MDENTKEVFHHLIWAGSGICVLILITIARLYRSVRKPDVQGKTTANEEKKQGDKVAAEESKEDAEVEDEDEQDEEDSDEEDSDEDDDAPESRAAAKGLHPIHYVWWLLLFVLGYAAGGITISVKLWSIAWGQ